MRLHTKNCVRCGKTASIWTRHVIHPDQRLKISAGWRKRCLDIPGFVGHYMSWMVQEEDK